MKSVSAPAQRHLDFGAPDFAPEAFLQSGQSARPWAALKTWKTWPGGVFCLCGETGSGKSHLASMWARSVGAPSLLGDTFDLAACNKIMQGASIVALIDHADRADETALFSLLTALERHGGGVLLVAHKPPSLWNFALPDLNSRLGALAYETMTCPEPELMGALIVRHAAAAGFRIDGDASQYLAARIPRTFEAAQAIVACMQSIDSATLKSSKALAQRALQALYKQGDYSDHPTTPDLFDD